MKPPSLDACVSESYCPAYVQGLPSNPTDLCAKPGKEDDKWQRFNLVKCELQGLQSCAMVMFCVPFFCFALACYS